MGLQALIAAIIFWGRDSVALFCYLAGQVQVLEIMISTCEHCMAGTQLVVTVTGLSWRRRTSAERQTSLGHIKRDFDVLCDCVSF